MNINYLMGLCFVAVSVAASLKFLVWWAASYPLTLIVAVVIFVAGWVWCVYESRNGQNTPDIPRINPVVRGTRK